MAVYTYVCGNCGFLLDYTIRINQLGEAEGKPDEKCAKCGELEMRRVYQTPGVIYKGEGYTGAGSKPRG